MNKVLLTGASGFIGRHCLPLLVSKGYEVHALSRRQPLDWAMPKVYWHEFDLLRPGSAAELLRHLQPEYALHLAWYAVPGKFWEARENLEWARASLEFLRAFVDQGGKRIVAAGSCAEYNSTAGECVEDATPLVPATLYGASKHAVQAILQALSRKTGLSSAWGRIFYLYGPHEPPTRLVAYVINSLLRGEPALCSEGRQILDFIHVEDVASAFVALLESEVQGPVNVGSGRPVAVRDVLQEIGRQLGRSELIHFGARAETSEPERFWANTQRLNREVGWAPRYDLARGIAQTVDWWRATAEMAAHSAKERASP